ncbi:adenylate/guanylate cyclase domain-containing protein [Rhizobium sp. AN80A]|uniref:adenylate/guanylate cyclase domain-containing protein n=1 Tax=Rhizobium sp. AN80A TaxID=3040673 RepID=UPI0024B38F3E|nr:adenylate/guanylate cyclase domain-containing protein [Rhizobium sp. AN80A]
MQSLSNPAPEPSELSVGQWPRHRTTSLDWLVNETRNERYIDNLLVQLCDRLRDEGIPVSRATMHFRTHHPQWLGARLLWRTGMTEAKITTFDYGTENTPQFLRSPVNEIFSGATEVRKDIEALRPGDGHVEFYDDLKREGVTEYIAWPMEHTLGKRHIVTFASDRPGGFLEEHVNYLKDLLPALTLVTEIRLKNIMARTLLQTYVGPHASEQILAGATTRGSGATVEAAILICDLRDFTTISDHWPRDDVIELLNGYFDAMSEPIEKHGGEILKFMGDGMLAIFPLSNPEACENLLQAIKTAEALMVELNAENKRKGREVLRYGIGVHVGEVMYGNIGSRRRLDFTVIGPAVNVASRLESLTKEIKRPVLLSRAFVEMAGQEDEMDSLGAFPLRGLGEPVDVFAFPLK